MARPEPIRQVRVRRPVEPPSRRFVSKLGGVDVVPDPFTSFEQRATDCFADLDLAPVPVPPRQRLAIVTCMDARIEPEHLFGLERGDAHVIRNAGARVTEDVIRSLIVSCVRLQVDHIAVIHHTECGAAEISHLDMCDHVLAATGSDPAGIDFMFFPNQPHTLQVDVQRLINCPYLPAGTAVAGYLVDSATGELTRRTTTARVRPHLVRRV